MCGERKKQGEKEKERAQGEFNMKRWYLKNKIKRWERNILGGEMEWGKVSLMKEARKNFFNGGGKGGGERKK